METKPIDFILSTLSITLLICLAFLTAWALSIDNPYHVLLDVAVFLLGYGLYTAGLQKRWFSRTENDLDWDTTLP